MASPREGDETLDWGGASKVKSSKIHSEAALVVLDGVKATEVWEGDLSNVPFPKKLSRSLTDGDGDGDEGPVARPAATVEVLIAARRGSFAAAAAVEDLPCGLL